MKFVWMNYHWIDSNFDGKFDIVVYNDVNLDGDKFPDKGLTAWVYDSDFDGKIDKAEYLSEGINKPVEKIHGAFIIKRATGETEISESMEGLFIFPNTALYDINTLLEGQSLQETSGRGKQSIGEPTEARDGILTFIPQSSNLTKSYFW